MGMGSGLGEMPGFLFGASNGDIIRRIPGTKLIETHFLKHPYLTIFVLASVPNLLFDVSSTLAGTYGLHPGRFIITTILGKIVRFTFVALVLGAVADAVS